LLSGELGSNAFRKFDAERYCFRGGFLISAFEAVALGVGYNIDKIVKSRRKLELAERVKSLWSDEEFIEWTGVGRSAGSRIPHSIKVGRKLFRP